ncbi:MAG: BlaI/MecI/CopY family transcriptional regulator [Myxococcota bacterium]
MKKTMLLTETELEMMLVLWDRGQGTVREVMNGLSADRPRAYTSVATILRILEEKGFVTSEKRGRRLLYAPTLSRSRYEGRNLGDLLGRLFGGDPLALVRRLVDSSSMSAAELRAARALFTDRLAGTEE